MSTPTTTSESSTKAAPQAERGVTMSGAEILVECLIREGVDTIFAYPGGASMHMHQALTKREDKIRTYLRNGYDWQEPLCRGSYGVWTDDPPLEGLRPGRRMYFFSNEPWTSRKLEQLGQRY